MATQAGCYSLALLLFLTFLNVRRTCPKIVEGVISTKEDWAFITRFCYKDSIGVLRYHFEYPKTFAVENILLYFDSQWPRVYPEPEMSCRDKEDKLYKGNNQVINLTLAYTWSGCKTEKVLGQEYYICDGDRRFISSRERWWYIALSNCDSVKGLQMKYRLEMTNGAGAWRHFSADERFILPMDIAFLVFFLLIGILSIYVACMLVSRRLFHFTYKMFVASLCFEIFSLSLYVAYFAEYSKTGMETYGLKVAARAFHFMSHVSFLLLLILMAKGWTVTRGRISSSGQIKLSIFGTLYTTCFAVLFFYEAAVFDPGKVLYIYESPAGIGICVLRVLAWFWFSYGTFFTLKHFPNKCTFYYPFWFFYTGWFLAGPLMIVIATFKIPKWERSQIVNGIDWSISIIAHLIFLGITRPSAANRNFPFHLRTNQIGIQELSPTRPVENGGSAGYALPTTGVPPPYYQPGHFTDITSMFLGSEVPTNTNKQPYQGMNGVQNGTQNGFQNGTQNGVQNGEVNGLHMTTINPSAPPPMY